LGTAGASSTLLDNAAAARAALFEQPADLFHPDFWRSVQQKPREGEILEVFPYRPERRLVIAN